MGTFRFGLLLALGLAVSGFAQDASPQPRQPGQPPPTLPPTVAPEVDPTLPAQIPQVEPAAEVVTPAATNAPAAAPKKPAAKKAPPIPTSRGKVAKLDKVAMTITVDVKGKQQVYKVTSKTRIFADAKPATFNDAKDGENVVVEYKTNKDKSREATALRFGSLTLKKE